MAFGLLVAACGMNLGDFSAKTLAGSLTPLVSFKGKPTVVVNVASL